MTNTIRAKKHVCALDCPDAWQLAQFYARLLGWRAVGSQGADWVRVLPPDGERAGFEIACQQIANYRRPDWPDGPVAQQMHLDFWVESIEESTPTALAAGAQIHEQQPGEGQGWRVFVDPVGHLFCLCEE